MSATLTAPALDGAQVKRASRLPRLLSLTSVAVAVGLAVSMLVESNTVMSLLTQAVIYAVFALGLGFLLKQNGMVSFGHALFFGLSGYLVGVGASLTGSVGTVVVLTIAGIGFFAFALALVIVRVPGIAFGMLTLAIGQSFYVLVSKSRGVTGGADGMSIEFPPRVFGLEIGAFQDPASMFLISWLALVALVLALSLLLGTRFGPLTEAIRENEERVRFIGFRTLLPRAVVFAISAMVTAVGGALSALYTGFVSPESLHWSVSGTVLIMVVLGGSRTLWGPAVGAVVYYLFRDYVGEHTTHWMGIFGVSLIAVIVLWPAGIAGGVMHAVERIKRGSGRHA
ncbi:branched-chain amino acid ABC transporter permease [Aromatoleum anaerobium]|uniref:Branched-chain amino acid ABC transporter permease n=1 Tax=Aromatoleum anaerobium TaxID=182180 RepID=A0ABX1PKD2_9RHOO|nr:branched-chain amino acid ABC transporter permease [Aromatoleum anaerobium]MCK0506567.1 branched-chain amino acid ABC transporter permease [Aromatoleum anaerobium]